jgi:putative acetyltransferase
MASSSATCSYHGHGSTPRQRSSRRCCSARSASPTYQHRGIGRALCDAAVARARQLHAPAIFLEGDPGYYTRLGWQRASSRGFTAPSARIPDAAFQLVLLPSWQPWMVGAVVYNDAFWTHDCVGLRTGP